MIVTVVLLTIAYGIGIGITAIIARLARKQFLDISKGKLPLKKTYWKPVEQREHRMEESFRQF